jgi:allophanate hydrolase subunit 2
VLEVTFGGLVLRAESALVVALTGAPAAGVPLNAPTRLAAGAELRLGPPRSGLRTYVAVRGGVDVPPVLGSRSTDLLSGLGPAPLAAGDVLAVGTAYGPMPGVDLAPVADPAGGEVVVRVGPGRGATGSRTPAGPH